MAADHEPIVCRTYTHARRHPMVLGRIAGWTPPFQLTVIQIAVLLVSTAIAVQTWRYWARPLPDELAAMLFIAVPGTLTWITRRVRVEGRSLARTLLGWILLWSSPAGGAVAGRPYISRPATSWSRSWIIVAAGPLDDE